MLTVTQWLIVVGVILAWLVLACIAAGHAVMYKRDARSATIWIFFAFALPFVGPWLYWVVGINRIKRRAVVRLGKRKRPFDLPQSSDTHPASDIHKEAVGHLVSLRTVADRVTRLPMLPGNRIVPLHNGEEAYPKMLEAIANADRSITLASYIFDWDDVGREFAAALGEAARRGVRVHVLLDGIGALRSFSRTGAALIQSGAELAAFFPLRFPLGRLRVNLRNHRKILVVDGHKGFTGGMNISERHLVHKHAPNRVEDLHFEVTGPVVAEMQHTFAEDWVLATDELLEGESYFPELFPTGESLCRGISSGPDEDLGIIHWMLQAALASAQHSVRIVTPYFIPTWPLISAMVLRAMRGVDITLILPSKVNWPWMRWAADAYLWQILGRGVQVYRQPPPFVHSKLIIVDERWILLGSANLDSRSLRLHFEFNIEAYDLKLARNLNAWVDDLIAQSTPVTLEEVESRSTWHRIRDGLAKIISPHL